jgi:hypothetical protein
MKTFRTSQDDPRRSAARILDTAEGVIIALRRCNLNQAFVEIATTAKRHDVALISLADALVAIVQNDPTADLDANAVRAARETWGALLDGRARDRVVHEVLGQDDQDKPGVRP